MENRTFITLPIKCDGPQEPHSPETELVRERRRVLRRTGIKPSAKQASWLRGIFDWLAERAT